MQNSWVLSPDQAHFDLDLGLKIQSPFSQTQIIGKSTAAAE